MSGPDTLNEDTTAAFSSVTENDANKANYEELKNHIHLAASRLKSMTPGTEKYDQGITDLEDYYERAVQDRMMRIKTIEAYWSEDKERLASAQKTAAVAMFMCALLFCTGSFYAFPAFSKRVLQEVVPYLTPDRIALNLFVFIVAIVISNYRKSGDLTLTNTLH